MKTSALFILIIVTFQVVTVFNTTNDLIDSISSLVEQQRQSQPVELSATQDSLSQQLVNNIKTTGQPYFIQCQVNDISSSISSYNFPSEVVSKINTIAFMQQTTFQGFQFSVYSGGSEYNQYFGTARNVNNQAQIAVVKADTTGSLVQQYQYTQEPTSSCHFCMAFWKGFKCCDSGSQTVKTPIGMTSTELEVVQTQLSNSGLSYIQSVLSNPPASFLNYDNNPSLLQNTQVQFQQSSAIPQLISELIQEVSILEQDIQELTEEIEGNQSSSSNSSYPHNTTTVLQTIVGQGFQNYEASSTFQKSLGVFPQFTKQFINLVLNSLNIPSQYQAQLQSMMNQVITSNSNKWITFSVLYNTPGVSNTSETNYVCVIGRRDAETGYTDWIQSQVSQSFDLEPNVFIVRHCQYTVEGDVDCTISEQDQQQQVSSTEAKDIFDFFQVVAYKKILSNLQMNNNQVQQFI